ncbi:MAG TPA: hypothetical protein VLF71_01100 [Candidatus Saccharimonadales bacterium]|nr:hypothetical protein [Candidatus Saccharimonadales bacterium]
MPSLVSEEAVTVPTLEKLAAGYQPGEAFIVNANAPQKVAGSSLVKVRLTEIREFVGDMGRDIPMSFITKAYRKGTPIRAAA